MKIIFNNNNDHKALKLKTYTAIIDKVETESIYNKLFGDMSNMSKLNMIIPDGILLQYIKTIVADKFIDKYKPIKGEIYMISVTAGNNVNIDMMLSLHEKLNEYFY